MLGSVNGRCKGIIAATHGKLSVEADTCHYTEYTGIISIDIGIAGIETEYKTGFSLYDCPERIYKLTLGGECSRTKQGYANKLLHRGNIEASTRLFTGNASLRFQKLYCASIILANLVRGKRPAYTS